MNATTWRGRKGVVLLGPTEDRVARYLVDRTKRGRVVIRTVDLIAALGLERSEAYRVTARLRTLGLFGVKNDQGGTRGGRWYWRTARTHDGARLDPKRHRHAWSRILGVARARSARLAEFLRRPGGSGALVATPTRPAVPPGRPAASFAELMRAAGLGGLMDQWRVT